MKLQDHYRMELGSVIGSDLFDLNDDIKQYLQDPHMPLITAIKIGLRYYITTDLILQLQILKDYLKIESFEKYCTLRQENQYE